MTVDELLPRLHGVRRTKNGWSAKCPGHDDRQNSLSVGIGDDGRILLTCFAGCRVEAIAKALGLEVRDLFADARRRGDGQGARGVSIPSETSATLQPPGGLTLAQYAEAKKLPSEFLLELGLSDISYLGRPAVRIPYPDQTGAEVAVRFRLALRGDNRFRWKTGTKPTLYGLSRSEDAKAAGYVVVVEGESDAQTLWFHDVPALGIPGAASWQEAWAEYLDGIPTIYVVIEPDRGGQAVARWLATSRIRDRVRLLTLDGAKDPSALHLADPDRFLERWQAALKAAPAWSERAAAAEDEEKRAAWTRCIDLARNPRILERFQQDLHHRGVTGETLVAKLLYLAVVSRLLERPVSVAIKGPSSAGKSFVSENVLAFFPSTAYYALSAMSERALAYSEEPLSHRFLVIYEAVGLQNEFANYLVRSLLSEGRVRYETVEKTKDGLRPRLIERPGPTGLIVTTTAIRLHEENETRFFTVSVTDSAEQTRAVLRQLARRRRAAVDLDVWHALQEWLARAEHRVVIPYAEALAELVPPIAVRLRRDFRAVLTLIEAHALLHQASREKDGDRAVIATLEDYAVVRNLVVELIAEGVEAVVPTTVRETVTTVETLTRTSANGVPVVAVARALKLDKSAAWRRVQVALGRTYLKNLETQGRRPARLVLGDPLPDQVEILPNADDPRLGGCVVARETKGITTPPSPQLEEVEL